MDTKKYWVCNCVAFVTKFCPKIQPWEYTRQIAKELIFEIIKITKGKVWEPSKQLKELDLFSKIFKDVPNAALMGVDTATTTTTPMKNTHKQEHKTTSKKPSTKLQWQLP